MSLFPPEAAALAADTIAALRAAGLRVTTAESCTGGLIAGALTEISGSSSAVGRGFVTYSNEAKQEMLAVPAATLEAHGAVSGDTVAAMTRGALAAAGGDADIAVAVSGIAGPDGGTPAKPVGLVFLAVERKGQPATVERHVFAGDRAAIRLATVMRALELVRAAAGGTPPA